MFKELIDIEVAYATLEQQQIIALRVPIETTAEQALELSNIATSVPEQNFKTATLGIFGKPCKRDKLLKQGDRVEVYRPLLCDPKQVRRNRAKN